MLWLLRWISESESNNRWPPRLLFNYNLKTLRDKMEINQKWFACQYIVDRQHKQNIYSPNIFVTSQYLKKTNKPLSRICLITASKECAYNVCCFRRDAWHNSSSKIAPRALGPIRFDGCVAGQLKSHGANHQSRQNIILLFVCYYCVLANVCAHANRIDGMCVASRTCDKNARQMFVKYRGK